jgi:integrase/recombinase XerD
MTELRRRMIEELQLRNYAPNTITVYIRCVAQFAQHFRLSPDRLGLEHIRQYQLFLVRQKKVSWALFNQTVCALLRFLYRHILHRDWMIEYIPYPRREDKLPVVLSPAEVAAVFEATHNLKHRTILMTIYAAGLRVSEVTHLRASDIDSQRQVIRVRQGKGHKDRQVMLSPKLLEALRIYWKSYRPRVWLFPGESPERPVSSETVWRVCHQAGEAAHLPKPISRTLCAIVSRPICWKTLLTCAVFKFCSDIGTSRLRPGICMFRILPCAPLSVRWSDCLTLSVRLQFDESAGVGAGRHFPPPRPGLPDDVWRLALA